ncbi:hypothetical protein ACJX0J_013003, partial [Zea mays]
PKELGIVAENESKEGSHFKLVMNLITIILMHHKKVIMCIYFEHAILSYINHPKTK